MRTPSPSRANRFIAYVVALVVVAPSCGGTSVGRSAAVPMPVRVPASLPDRSPLPSPTQPPPPSPIERSRAEWASSIGHAVGSTRSISIAVGVGRRIVFAHLGSVRRLPASNQKLLTSMAALDLLGPRYRFPTMASATGRIRDGVLDGNLWLVGSGDPELAPPALSLLASRLRARGLRRITGSIVGDLGAFHRGWWAPGWLPGVSRNYVRRSTALAFQGNQAKGAPELAAASVFTTALRAAGVMVEGEPTTGLAPSWRRVVAAVRSSPLSQILARQNHGSINFDAEMITKAVGTEVTGEPGSTASGADAIEDWAAGQGVRVEALDGSGLSHLDDVSAIGLVTLLLRARRHAWWPALFRSLPSAGEGTLAGRLSGTDVHAKTGTLFVTPVSALSGYVRDAAGRLVAFSVLSRGISKSAAIAIEDLVVRTLASARVE